MKVTTMTASHAFGKGRPDPSFSSAGNAGAAIAKFGKENVVDATLGVLKDDEGNFLSLPTVEKIYRSLPADELMDYAPIEGLSAFLSAAKEFMFQGHQPKGTYTSGVATMGGSGGIRHMIYNYVDEGETFLIPTWHWGPYREMATEYHRKWELYEMFDENDHFNLKGMKEKALEILAKQNTLMAIFNTPANNPSGYSMTDEDWKEITDFFRQCAKDESKKLIILWDMAYIDYAGDPHETRSFLKFFEDMPENILTAVAFSMSKAFSVYGMRGGALMCLTTSKEVADEFEQVNTYSNRTTWSNGARGVQKMLVDIMADSAVKEQIDKEREAARLMLANRAELFVKEAREVGLHILPYQSGFFITVPARDTAGLADKLAKRNIFVIPLARAIRFAISAVPTRQIPGLATAAKELFAGHEPD
ncbi:MAG: aminotransferase class I/II-fold pyridoxal phosphate-dependent enzyme [Oscillospiraceae bacterium]|jgi:aromatic-amino-acid transaminase|nr:aminotransferase class I/II-fold pyridoxal phosphate-dependent enzyme [Oscillospiraceae bacterium]